jgi:hypothetical protein
MPVTPFHLGVGLLGKGLAPRTVSLSAFAVSQIVIDCETAYYLFVVRQWPVHRWAHTFLIGALVGVAVGAATAGIARLLLSAEPGAPLAPEWGFSQCLGGGLVGGVTHPLLDGIMHTDIQPLLPFASGNPFLGLIGLGPLHLLCVAAGALGVILLLSRSATRQTSLL